MKYILLNLTHTPNGLNKLMKIFNVIILLFSQSTKLLRSHKQTCPPRAPMIRVIMYFNTFNPILITFCFSIFLFLSFFI